MERIKNLNLYQKGILLLLVLMFVIFTAVYSVTYKREGFAYEGAMLYPSEENGQTVYAGKLNGKAASFTVSADKAVIFRCGDKTYGPYTLREDPTAIPKDSAFTGQLKGIEILNEEEIFFRGGVFATGKRRLLVPEDGSAVSGYWVSSDGAYHFDLKQSEPIEPTASAILDVMEGPELTRKGNWELWFYGMITSIITAVSMLFADELFRWNLSWQIRDVYQAEPSDWEMFTRYAGWTLLPVLAIVAYSVGLKV